MQFKCGTLLLSGDRSECDSVRSSSLVILHVH